MNLRQRMAWIVALGALVVLYVALGYVVVVVV